MPEFALLWDLFIDHEALSLLGMAGLLFGLAAMGRAVGNRCWSLASRPSPSPLGGTQAPVLPGADA